MNSEFTIANWIRLAPEAVPPVNDHADFATDFELNTAVESGTLAISADSNFAVWLDGELLGTGQFSDLPDAPTWSAFPVAAIAPGRHRLAILTVFHGHDFSTYRTGTPGVIAELSLSNGFRLGTGAAWLARRDPAWTNGPRDMVSGQLGFTAEYDARQDDRWQDPAVRLTGWAAACERPAAGTPIARPVPPLLRLPRIDGTIVMQGTVLRPQSEATPAMAVRSDFLHYCPPGEFFGLDIGEFGCELPRVGERTYRIPAPSAPANGSYLVIDLGDEFTGEAEFDLTAPAGTILDLSHGEQLHDGRVRNRINIRSFTDRYHCRSGRNRFRLLFRRLGCRYLQLTITNCTEPVELHTFGLAPTVLPLPERAEFDNGDLAQLQLRRAALHTMELCMHEHYEDCPWREQALYAYDSRNQALFGYYAWGNYPFAAASFSLLGNSMRVDGWLELCAPARIPLTIPVFTLAWGLEVIEHYLHSGDPALFLRFRPQITAIIERLLGERDPQTGLIPAPQGKEIWNFYEWVDGLSGSMGETGKRSYHTLFHCYFLRLLTEFDRALGWQGETPRYSGTAAELRSAARRGFRDPRTGLFASCRCGDVLSGAHEHTQALAFLAGLVSEPELPQLRQNLREATLVPCSFSSFPFLCDALFALGQEERRTMYRRLDEAFLPMVFSGSTTLWETPRGEADFDGAGSRCHAWSSVPVYVQGAMELGIRPLEPGFRRFTVSPCPRADTLRVAGEVPTPYGAIKVELRREGAQWLLALTHPKGTEPVPAPLPEAPFRRIDVTEV